MRITVHWAESLVILSDSLFMNEKIKYSLCKTIPKERPIIMSPRMPNETAP